MPKRRESDGTIVEIPQEEIDRDTIENVRLQEERALRKEELDLRKIIIEDLIDGLPVNASERARYRQLKENRGRN